MFPFRDRDNKSFTRESADEIMEQLRRSADEERKRFFDSNLKRRDPAAHSRGFSFDDDPFKRKTSRLKDDLHGYLAERFPDVAEQLKDWSDDSVKFKRHLDEQRPPSGRRHEQQNPFERQKTDRQHCSSYGRRDDLCGQGTSRQESLRNTVPNMQTQQDGLSEKQRNARSQSAPPEGTAVGAGFRPDKVNFTPMDKNGEANHQASNANIKNSHSQQEEQPKPQSHSTKSNERYIPIFVEGRGETIVNMPVNHDKPPQPTSSFARQSPPRTAASANTAPKEATDVSHQKRASTPNSAQPSAAPAEPNQQRSATPSGTAPLSQESSQDTSQERATTPAPPRPPSPMTLVANVQKDVHDLKELVDAFKGSKSSKEYIYLDEMLTRNLLKLDNIETGGKEEVRAARKEVIKLIQECINVLESSNQNSGSPSQ